MPSTSFESCATSYFSIECSSLHCFIADNCSGVISENSHFKHGLAFNILYNSKLDFLSSPTFFPLSKQSMPPYSAKHLSLYNLEHPSGGQTRDKCSLLLPFAKNLFNNTVSIDYRDSTISSKVFCTASLELESSSLSLDALPIGYCCSGLRYDDTYQLPSFTVK